MTGADQSNRPAIAAALEHDMIGRVMLRAGSRVFQSVYSPVFEHGNGVLKPVFVTAHCADVLSDTDGEARQTGSGRAGERVAAAMHRANLVFRDPEHLGYCEVLPERGQLRDHALGGLLAGARASGLEAEQVIWHCGAQGTARRVEACRIARDMGMKVCASLDLREDGLPDLAGFTPDIVQMSPQWSAGLLAGVPGAARLARTVTEALEAEGSAVWMDAIGTTAELQAALNAGVRYLQGPALGKPVVAGSETGWRSLNVQALLMEHEGAVVPLRRRG